MGALLALALGAPSLAAQRRDTVRVDTLRADTLRADTARRADTVRAQRRAGRGVARAAGPPISPRRAFLQSLLVPGWGQASLDRGLAGAIFVTVEIGSAAMAVRAKHDLDLAKRFRADSVLIGFDQSGNPRYELQPPGSLVRARRQHFEDYIALLAFNHLLAGADAFVAAHLWDLPARVSVRPRGGGLAVSARVAW